MHEIKGFQNGFEIWIDYGPGYRVYCIERNKTNLVLLCAGLKKTQNADIRRAMKMVKDYNEMIKRKKEEELKRRLPEKMETLTKEEIDYFFDAIQDEDTKSYLGISKWED